MAINSRVLVTGGAGFIGSNLSDELIKKDNSVYIIDNFSSGKKENLHKKANLIEADISKIDWEIILKKIKPHTIYHFAAQSSLQKSLENPNLDVDTGLRATISILTQIKRLHTQPKFIFASSAAVYPIMGKMPYTEKLQTSPSTPYGIVKLSCEYFINYFSSNYGLNYVILRFSNVYGPRQNSSAEGGVVAIFVKNLIENTPIAINNSGNQTRDFVYVSDVVRACMLASKLKKSNTLNISSAKRISINYLANHLKKIANSNVKTMHVKTQINEAKHSLLSNKKAKNILAWSPRISLNEGLEYTIEFFSER